MNADTRSRAAEILGVPGDAAATDAISAFLASLPASSFVPTGDRVAAVNALAGSTAPADATDDSALSLSAQVEAFARRFWSLAPSDRLAEWVSLSDRAAEDPADARLLALQAGLEVVVDPLPNPVVEEVAGFVRELFVLNPRERAIRRNEWLLANIKRHAELSKVAVDLQRQRPAMTALEPALFERLASRFGAAVFAEGATAEPRKRLSSAESMEAAKAAFVDRIQTYSARQLKSPAAESDSSSGCAGGYIAAMIIFVVLRLMVGSGSSSNSPTRYTPPTFPELSPRILIPSGTSGKGLPMEEVEAFKKAGVVALSAIDIDACIRHDRDTNALRPENYERWVKAGRPRNAGVFFVPPGDLREQPKRP
jgi:hypothetical protein